jgi:hypothetical protein
VLYFFILAFAPFLSFPMLPLFVEPLFFGTGNGLFVENWDFYLRITPSVLEFSAAGGLFCLNELPLDCLD